MGYVGEQCLQSKLILYLYGKETCNLQGSGAGAFPWADFTVVRVWVSMEDVLDCEACVLACRSWGCLFCHSTQNFALADWFQRARAEIPVGRKPMQERFSATYKSLCFFSFWVLQLVHCGTHLILVVVPFSFFLESVLFVYFRK